MQKLAIAVCLVILCSLGQRGLQAQEVPRDACPRPAVGSAVPEPEDLRSQNGVLSVQLTVRNQREKDGSTRYCYVYGDGVQSPSLRLKPGDLLILKLKNDLSDPDQSAPGRKQVKHGAAGNADPCQSGAMASTSTNLHFHGLTVPPICHQDEVLKTSVQPYRPALRIPLPHPRKRVPRFVLVSPAYSWIQ
jgi:FtsP/CotA-like multicopper oxidase with cupredoxin domain